jgi:DNA ligase-1
MLSFNKFAETLENISQHRSRNKIIELLGQFFQTLRAEEARNAAYLLLGALGPTYAPVRFNLADKQLRTFLQVFVLEVFGTEAEIIFCEKFAQAGDLGQALFLLSSELGSEGRPCEQEAYSFLEMFESLRDLALCAGIGSVGEKREKLFALLRKVSAVGQKYLIKIIGAQLRLGFSTSTLLEVFVFMAAPDLDKSDGYKSLKKLLEANYHVCADVGLLVYRLKQFGLTGLENPVPTIGIPVCPAAAERVADLTELLARQQDFVVQPKLDGLRVQIHKEGGLVKLFSRNLLDISDMLPEVTQAFANFAADGFIVEGEVLGYDEARNSDVNFQTTSQRRRKHDVSEMAAKFPVRVFLFDLLMLEKISCLPLAYFQRREKLERAFSVENPLWMLVTEGGFSCAKGTERELELAKDGVLNYFSACISQGYEGIVAKKKAGLYEPGKRGFNWIKIKHLAQCKVRDTVDAVIIGFFFGKGRRAELGLGALLVAVYDAETNTFQTVAKVGTGLADAELSTFWKELRELQLPQKPANFNVSKTLKPDGWVEAKLVIEVEADDITVSKVHTAAWGKVSADRGLALRFPCLKKRRMDKGPEQTTSPGELARLVRLRLDFVF